MKGKSTYYLGRVMKLGALDQAGLRSALLQPAVAIHRKRAWTFIDIQEHQEDGEHFIYGRLSKYSPDGQVRAVDEALHKEVEKHEPNLSIAAAQFVYIPEYSGIAYMHVATHIEKETFEARFRDVVKEFHQGVLVDCEIEPLTDLRTFSAKLKRLFGIHKISARVFPPNPMFGPLWESLKEYLISRNTDKLSVTEESIEALPIKTDLPALVEGVANQTESTPLVLEKPVPFADAAILMAADGYGSGTVTGQEADGQWVTIKTSETVKNFTLTKNPEPYDLFRVALEIFREVERQRHLRN